MREVSQMDSDYHDNYHYLDVASDNKKFEWC